MRLEIKDDKKISTVQKEFNEIFPYLKLEFFEHPHGHNKGSQKRDMKNNSITLGECRKKHNKGELIISDNTTAAELESHFYDVFGLSVQVFRKSGTLWLETTVTDDWTLKQQNDHGRELSTATYD